jgi:hypothetical protein
MADLDYSNALTALQNELGLLAQQREHIDRRISDVSAAYKALVRIHEVETSPPAPLPIIKKAEEPKFQVKASVLEVVESTDGEISALEIRDALVLRGWKIENYRNPLAVVHTILRRLVKNGDIVVSATTGCGKYYQGREHWEEKQARDWEQDAARRAASKAKLAARAEARALLVEPCYEILRDHPEGISARAIGTELENNGIDMSCFDRKASAVAAVLTSLPDVKGVLTQEWQDGPIRNYYYLVQKSETNPKARR